jgi:predicted RNA-binding protein YlxR (DUF448 family)
VSPAFERSCVGCRTRASRPALHRFVVAAGTILADDVQHARGRGAYLCATCVTRPPLAQLRRALRAPAASLSPTPATDR